MSKPTHVEIVDEKAEGGRRTILAANFHPGRGHVRYAPPAGEEEEHFDGEEDGEGAGDGGAAEPEAKAEKPKKGRGARS